MRLSFAFLSSCPHFSCLAVLSYCLQLFPMLHLMAQSSLCKSLSLPRPSPDSNLTTPWHLSETACDFLHKAGTSTLLLLSALCCLHLPVLVMVIKQPVYHIYSHPFIPVFIPLAPVKDSALLRLISSCPRLPYSTTCKIHSLINS